MKIRTLVIDDEPHAREGMKIRLLEFPKIEIIGECSSGKEAAAAINNLKPDLLFLDIQMPEMNGFEVLQQIDDKNFPMVVFVTAFDKYALQAFEFHALDYLLKPISDERLKETMEVIIRLFKQKDLASYGTKMKNFIDEYISGEKNSFDTSQFYQAEKTNPYVTRLMIKSKENISLVPVTEVEWIESAGDYIYIHTNGKKHLFRETLTSLEHKLDPSQFVRIHRSTIVNLEKIKSLKQNEHGDYEVFLINGIKLKLSRSFKQQFQKAIGNSL